MRARQLKVIQPSRAYVGNDGFSGNAIRAPILIASSVGSMLPVSEITLVACAVALGLSTSAEIRDGRR